MTSTPPETGVARRSSWRIFWPTVALAVGAAIYSGYWYVVAGEVRAAIEGFAAAPAGDVAVGWRDLSISGYPYRIAATFAAPVVRAPNAPETWEWSAPSVEADLLPYDLRHVVLKVDGEQILKYRDAGGHHVVSATSKGAWASHVAVPGAPVGRIAFDFDDLVARHDVGSVPGARFAAGRLQLHAQPAGAASYDVALQGEDMDVPRLKATSVLGPRIALVSAQTRFKDLPDSAHASFVEISRGWLARGGTLAISDLTVKWGPLDLRARGELTLDAERRPQGRFDAAFADYESLVGALAKAKVVRERDAELALAGLGLVAQLQNDEEGRVHVPVLMNDGKLFLGPLLVARLEPLF